jgi:hypothetical protein
MARRSAASPAAHTFTFRICILGSFYAPPGALETWREIELRADQTLADLGEAIPSAFGSTTTTLWSFFLSGKSWDRPSEYARMPDPDLMTGARPRGADRLRGKDAAAVIQGVTGYDEQAYRAELRAWRHERGDAAAGELADYVRATLGFKERMLALAALEEAGPAAEAEVRAMLTDADLRPLAQMWLVQRGLEDESSLEPASAVVLMAETLASILDSDGPAGLVKHLEQFGPPDEQAAMLDNLWRARTPHATAVLEAVGNAHPDSKVAKAARKAAFKQRSSGGR